MSCGVGHRWGLDLLLLWMWLWLWNRHGGSMPQPQQQQIQDNKPNKQNKDTKTKDNVPRRKMMRLIERFIPNSHDQVKPAPRAGWPRKAKLKLKVPTNTEEPVKPWVTLSLRLLSTIFLPFCFASHIFLCRSNPTALGNIYSEGVLPLPNPQKEALGIGHELLWDPEP